MKREPIQQALVGFARPPIQFDVEIPEPVQGLHLWKVHLGLVSLQLNPPRVRYFNAKAISVKTNVSHGEVPVLPDCKVGGS